jgi:protein TonB
MRGGTRGKGGESRWRRSLAFSFALHALVLAAIGVAASARNPEGIDTHTLGAPTTSDSAEAPTTVDLAEADTVLSSDPNSSVPVIRAEDPIAAPAGDRANAESPAASHLVDGSTMNRRAPASDRGAGTGQVLPELASRRDASTLHERLTDGAAVNQSSHARTARVPTSAQAVRREPETGLGDSPRDAHQRPASTAAQYGIVDPDAPGVGPETLSGTGIVVAAVPVWAAPRRRAEDRLVATASGPLDADRGARSYDVDGRGVRAADDRAIRAASNEGHPSITDLSLASVSGNTREGHGPSDTPGAVSRETKGSSPAPVVAPRGTSDGLGEEARHRERLYNRYTQEIGARVKEALIWPRTLAIRLEQGETVVRFVILPDGRLSDGIRVIKSSGFSEFDQAALDAVRKASPFPPMRDAPSARPLSVNLPVTFSNPVIR